MLDMLVLHVLSLEPRHGYGITAVARNFVRHAQINQGSLYPARHRLEQKGWLRLKWAPLGTEPGREVLFGDPVGTEASRVGEGELEPG